MSILVLLFPIVGPLLLWLLFILARAARLLMGAARGWDDWLNRDVRAEAMHRSARLSLDTRVPSPMLRRIECELQTKHFPEKVLAKEALDHARIHRN